MRAGAYGEFLYQQGSLELPIHLLEQLQALDISPEELGYLVLALGRSRQKKRQKQQQPEPQKSESQKIDGQKPEEGLAQDPWTSWALNKGWGVWQGRGKNRQVVFTPLWEKLYQLWEKEQLQAEAEVENKGKEKPDFDYSRILKELDRLRGGLSVTTREQQLIQEFNLKYGWSSDFILTFLQMCFQRGLTQIKSYRPLAAQVNRAGIYTLEGLVTFMDEIDWISQKAAEIKKDYLGLYGMVTVTERDLYVKWNQHWQMPHSVILRAAQETVGASNASFKYVDKVLEDWQAKGVNNLETAEQAIKQRQAEKRQIWEQKNLSGIENATAAKVKAAAGNSAGGRRLVERGNKNWEGIE